MIRAELIIDPDPSVSMVHAVVGVSLPLLKAHRVWISVSISSGIHRVALCATYSAETAQFLIEISLAMRNSPRLHQVSLHVCECLHVTRALLYRHLLHSLMICMCSKVFVIEILIYRSIYIVPVVYHRYYTLS